MFVAVGLAMWGHDVWLVVTSPRRLAFPAEARAQVAFVPSGDPGPRTVRAIELFREGRVDGLVFSGAGYGGDDAHALARRATTSGVPTGAIFVEGRARNTWQNVEFGQIVLDRHDFTRVVVVTHRAHAARVAWLFSQACLPFEVRLESVGPEPSIGAVALEGTKLFVSRLAVGFGCLGARRANGEEGAAGPTTAP